MNLETFVNLTKGLRMISEFLTLIIMLPIVIFFPLLIWVPNRIAELMVAGEDERIPNSLRWLVKEEYIEAVREGKKKHNDNWRWIVAIVGSFYPLLILCTTTTGNLVFGLTLIATGVTVFFICVALLEWALRPRNL